MGTGPFLAPKDSDSPGRRMKPTTTICLALLILALGCADDPPLVPEPRPNLDGTPFEYVVSFYPADEVFGNGGQVRGMGAGWTWSRTSNTFVLELPPAQVEGTPFGGTGLVIALHAYATDAGGLPQNGQYSIGLATPEFNGRGWLRDPTRIWSTNSPGFLFLDTWHPDGSLDGRFALQVSHDPSGEGTATPSPSAGTVVGSFTAKRSEP